MEFKRRDYSELAIFALFLVIYYFLKLTRNPFAQETSFAIGSGVIGLILAIRASERAVEGTDLFGKRVGLSVYVAGVLSSLASNTPELVIAGFAAIKSVELAEFAVALIMTAVGFNILLLGILIMVGAYRSEEGYIEVPDEVMQVEVPIMRATIVILGSVFALGVVLFIVDVGFGTTVGGMEKSVPHLPIEAAIIMVLIYLAYMFFIIRYSLRNVKKTTSSTDKNIEHPLMSMRFISTLLLVGFGGIFFAGEIISSSVEAVVTGGNWNEFQVAFLVGAAAAVPEHSIALIASGREGGIELGLGNLLAGTMQNLLLIFGITAILASVFSTPEGIPLVHFVHDSSGVIIGAIPFILVQIGFSWLLVFLIKSSMTDDKKLDMYEGFTIFVAQIFVFVIFLKGVL